jgi:hypothetical protein
MYLGLTDVRNTAEIPALTARSHWKNVLQRIHVFTRGEGQREAKTREIHHKVNPDDFLIIPQKNDVLIRSN